MKKKKKDKGKKKKKKKECQILELVRVPFRMPGKNYI